MKICPLCGRRTALPLAPHIKECHVNAMAAERKRGAASIMQELRFLLLSNGFWLDELRADQEAALVEGFRKAFGVLKAFRT